MVCLSLSAWHFPTPELKCTLYIEILTIIPLKGFVKTLSQPSVCSGAWETFLYLRDVLTSMPHVSSFPYTPTSELLVPDEAASFSVFVRSFLIPGGSTGL